MQARRTWKDWETRTIAFLQCLLLEAQENLGAFRESTPLLWWSSAFHYLLACIFLTPATMVQFLEAVSYSRTHILQHFCPSALFCVHINPLSVDVSVDISVSLTVIYSTRSAVERSHNNHDSGHHLTSGRLWHRNTCAAREAALCQADRELNSPSEAAHKASAGLCSETGMLQELLFLKWALLPGDAAGRRTVFSSGVAVVQQQNDAFLWQTETPVTDKCRVLYINQQLSAEQSSVFTDVRFEPSILHGGRDSVILPLLKC